MEVFQKIWGYARRYKLYLIAGVIFIFLNILTAMVPGYLNRRIIDDVITAGMIELLPGLLVTMLVTNLLRSLFIFLERYNVENLSQSVLRDLKQDLYDHLQKMSFDFYNKNRTGELMSRMTGDMEAIRRIISEGIIQITQSVLFLLLTGMVLFTLNVKLTIISLMASPLIGFFAYRLSGTILPAFSKVREQFSRLNTTVQENISGIRIVKVFNQQCFELEKFDEDNNRYFCWNYRVARIWAQYYPVLEFLGGVSTLLLLFFGGRLVITGEISLGVWMQFNSYLWMLVMPIGMLGHLINLINVTIASGERIFNLLAEEPGITNPEKVIIPENTRGEVEFRGVSLKYGDQFVLRDINLRARPGSVVAIMGETGSGKSSLVNLIPRYYEPTTGVVYIDGIDNRKLDLKYLRKQVSLVMQETFLFSETIKSNIAYGRPDASLQEVKKAARIAGASDFIEEMEEGYETVVGERGMGLSGGQKQRVSLARALLKKSPILILDDATSAVDMETELRIQEALENMEYKPTVFIIAHRISSVRNADQIIVLKEGRIVEQGTHKELIKMKGEYYKIFKEQYKELLKDERLRRRLMA